MRILVTRTVPNAGLALLKKKRGIILDIYRENNVIPKKELIKRIKNADILLCLLTDHIDAEVLAHAPHLKMIANYAVGFDNIDLREAGKRGILVTNTPAHEVSEAVAEHSIALILALMRNIATSNTFTKKGLYHGWDPQGFLGASLSKKTLGIIGGGAIGTELAKRLHDGFDVNIIYSDPQRNVLLETAYNARHVSLTTLLKSSDMVSVHVPLNKQTHHLLGKKELMLMKKTAYLINTARGAIVDESALYEILKKERIAGAALDVFECEPNIACTKMVTEGLKKHPNVILTPHIASATKEARDAMSIIAAKNILAFINGKKPENLLI